MKKPGKDKVRDDQRAEGLKMARAEGEPSTVPDRVENHLVEAAAPEWAKGRWKGKVMISALMPFLQNLGHKATIEEVDAFVESQKAKAPVYYGWWGEKSYMDENLLKAWEDGVFKGKVVVEVLVEKCFKQLGRKATIEDVKAFIEEGDRRREAMRNVFETTLDPDISTPVTCACATHIGENTGFRAETEYATYFDKQLGKRIRSTYTGSGKEIRVGQFLVVGDKIVAYCKNCKRATDEGREEKRRAAYNEGKRGYDLPKRMPWMTYKNATEMLTGIKTTKERNEDADIMANEALSTFVENRHRDAKADMKGGGRSRGRDYRRRV